MSPFYQEYPWPPGKAPWAVERGGTGIPPDGARENWGKNKFRSTLEDRKPELVRPAGEERGKRPTATAQSGGLPSVDNVKPPKSEEEAIKMIQLSQKLLVTALESNSRLKFNELGLAKTFYSTMVEKFAKKRLPSFSSASATATSFNGNGHHSPPRERRPSTSQSFRRSRERNSRSPSGPPMKRER